MSKKRKTRKEKELTRLRREVVQNNIAEQRLEPERAELSQVSYSVTNIKPKTEKEKKIVFPNQSKGFITNHEYVLHDAKHTLIASGILIILYTILYLFKDYFFTLIIH